MFFFFNIGYHLSQASLDLVVNVLRQLWLNDEGSDDEFFFKVQGQQLLILVTDTFKYLQPNFIKMPKLVLFAAHCFLLHWEQLETLDEISKRVLKAYAYLAGWFYFIVSDEVSNGLNLFLLLRVSQVS